jgi:hypothetical protein
MHTKHLITHPSRDTYVDDIAQLQRALTTAKSDAERIECRTRLEQAAGRKALGDAVKNHAAMKGKEELQRRFGTPVLAASWEIRDGEYWADVIVQPADGAAPMTFTERLDEFPSDECITNIALIV